MIACVNRCVVVLFVCHSFIVLIFLFFLSFFLSFLCTKATNAAPPWIWLCGWIFGRNRDRERRAVKAHLSTFLSFFGCSDGKEVADVSVGVPESVVQFGIVPSEGLGLFSKADKDRDDGALHHFEHEQHHRKSDLWCTNWKGGGR